MAELVTAVAQIIVAMAALVGIGGAGIYVVNRKRNGQSSLPGTLDDETLDELRAIHKTLKANGDKNSEEHKEMLDTLAPRRTGG